MLNRSMPSSATETLSAKSAPADLVFQRASPEVKVTDVHGVPAYSSNDPEAVQVFWDPDGTDAYMADGRWQVNGFESR